MNEEASYLIFITYYLLSNTGQIKYKTSPRLTAPLSLSRRGDGGEVRLLHLITPTYLLITCYLSPKGFVEANATFSKIYSKCLGKSL